MVVIYEVALLRTEVSVLRKLIRSLVSDGELKKYVYGLEGYLLYKRYRIYWIRRLWVSK